MSEIRGFSLRAREGFLSLVAGGIAFEAGNDVAGALFEEQLKDVYFAEKLRSEREAGRNEPEGRVRKAMGLHSLRSLF